ncbi:putative membrane protein YczE [Aeromicrobium panaciterrae]|uniref:Membrane protein YczE n=1 Tax=Aeromicrobium panaciterrae TaxID=363861 RepID=A0ABU1UQM1_9ACTN|nr:putative membrane protein YczE [Aeromicrobium panaciterrae]
MTRMPERLVRLIAGLFLYGFTMAMMVESTLGLDPWDVFHEGVAEQAPLTFGQVVIVTGAIVLLLWIPLKQIPGIGTVLNVIIIGLAADLGIAVITQPDNIWLRGLLLVGGVVGNGFAGALYIGAQLGPGPRDGLWLALVKRTRRSVRFWRTTIEVTVLVVGFLLGGTVGVGTVLYALTIGPIVQFFLPLAQIDLSAASGDDERGVDVDEHLDGSEPIVGQPALTNGVDATLDDGRPER